MSAFEELTPSLISPYGTVCSSLRWSFILFHINQGATVAMGKEKYEEMVQREVTVKIMRKVSKKRYFKDKNVYTYERLYVPIPKQFHDKIQPFLNKNLEVEVTPKNSGFEIVCSPVKTFLSPENTQRKLSLKPNPNPLFYHQNVNSV